MNRLLHLHYRELEEKLSAEKKKEVEERQRSDSEKRTFCETMSPAELTEWLLEELGSEYKDDIDKLRSKIKYTTIQNIISRVH